MIYIHKIFVINKQHKEYNINIWSINLCVEQSNIHFDILTHLCRWVRSTFAVRETQSLGQQMLNAPVGINGLRNQKSCIPGQESTENYFGKMYRNNIL